MPSDSIQKIKSHQVFGRVAFITGASSGIGYELALQLARRGYQVGLLARRQDQLEQLATRIRSAGGKAAVAACDITDRKSVGAAFATLRSELGTADLLIASAGVSAGIPIARHGGLDAAKAALVYQTNVLGLLYSVEAVLPDMLARRAGHIVGIASIAAYRSFPESHAYCGSKAAVKSQLEGLRLELMPLGIDVSVICPGFIATPMTAVNRFKMPFILTTEQGCQRIVRAIERRCKNYTFPRRLYCLVQLTKLLPDRLIARIFAASSGKSLKNDP